MIFSKDISGASKKLCFSSLFPSFSQHPTVVYQWWNCFNDAGGVVEETRQTWMEFSIASPWRRLISSPTKFWSKKSSKHRKTIEKKQNMQTTSFNWWFWTLCSFFVVLHFLISHIPCDQCHLGASLTTFCSTRWSCFFYLHNQLRMVQKKGALACVGWLVF